jgi:hypothetical protein
MLEPAASWLSSWKLAAALGLFFGLGYLFGFFTGFGYSKSKSRVEIVEIYRGEQGTLAPSADRRGISPKNRTPSGTAKTEQTPPIEQAIAVAAAAPMQNIGLVLSDNSLGEDENGLYISGTVLNRSDHAFNAVRVAFDLCDSQGTPYNSVTDMSSERMEPGDAWGFTIYIPYTEMSLFSSYRLQSIMGVNN